MTKLNKFLFVPYLIWMVGFIIIPVILLVYFSFLDIHGHFSFSNYQQIFSLRYLKMMGISIFYAAVITLVTLIISYPAAYFIRQSAHQNLWILILIIPTWINLLLKTYAFIGIFSHDGIINQILGVMHLPKTELLFKAGQLKSCSAFYNLSVGENKKDTTFQKVLVSFFAFRRSATYKCTLTGISYF